MYYITLRRLGSMSIFERRQDTWMHPSQFSRTVNKLCVLYTCADCESNCDADCAADCAADCDADCDAFDLEI